MPESLSIVPLKDARISPEQTTNLGNPLQDAYQIDLLERYSNKDPTLDPAEVQYVEDTLSFNKERAVYNKKEELQAQANASATIQDTSSVLGRAANAGVALLSGTVGAASTFPKAILQTGKQITEAFIPPEDKKLIQQKEGLKIRQKKLVDRLNTVSETSPEYQKITTALNKVNDRLLQYDSIAPKTLANSQTAQNIQNVVDSIKSVEAVLSSRVNRTNSAELEVDAEIGGLKTKEALDKGNYGDAALEVISSIAKTYADSPVAALDLFIESIPQMVSAQVVFMPTLYSDFMNTVGEMESEYTKFHLEPPTRAALGKIYMLASVSAFANVASDRFLASSFKPLLSSAAKVALTEQGMKGVTLTFAERLITKIPYYQKAIRLGQTTVGKVAIDLGFEPAQEFVSGAASEASMQSATTDAVDTAKITSAGIQEAVAALGGTSPGSALKVNKINTAVLTAAGKKTVDIGKKVKEVITGKVSNKIANTILVPDTAIDPETNKPYRSVKEAKVAHSQRINKGVEILSDNLDKKNAVLSQSEKKSFDIALGTIEESLPSSTKTPVTGDPTELADAAEKLILKETPEDVADSVKNDILYSISHSDDLNPAQARELGQLDIFTPEEKEKLNTYANVTEQIKSGVDEKYVGAEIHTKLIQILLNGNKISEAKIQYAKLNTFKEYMNTKLKAFRDVAKYNVAVRAGDTPELPGILQNVKLGTQGKILRFGFKNTAGFGIKKDGTPKLWKAGSETSFNSLIATIDKDVKYLNFRTDAIQQVMEEVLNVPISTPLKSAKEVSVEDTSPSSSEDIQAPPTEEEIPLVKKLSTVLEDTSLPDIGLNLISYREGAGASISNINQTSNTAILESPNITQIFKARPGTKRKRSLLQKIPKLMPKLKKALADKTIQVSAVKRDRLLNIIKFTEGFEEAANKTWIQYVPTLFTSGNKGKLKDIDWFSENPVTYFFRQFQLAPTKGQQKPKVINRMDKNIIASMSLHSLNWLALEAPRLLVNTDDTIRGILRIKDKELPLSPGVHFLRYAGVNEKIIAASLGRKIFQDLLLVPKGDVNQYTQDRTELALGIMALKVLEELGYIEAHSIPVYLLVQKPVNKNATITFIRARAADANPLINRIPKNPTKKFKLHPLLANARKTFLNKDHAPSDSYSSLLKDIFDIETLQRFPSVKPQKVKTTFGVHKQKRPKRIMKALQKAQTTGWRIRKEVQVFLDSSTPEIQAKNEKILRTILGYTFDIETLPLYKQQEAVGRNISIDRDIENAFTFFNQLQAAGETQFYFTYNTGKSSRHLIEQSDFNPQASKFIRGLVHNSAWEIEVDPKGTTSRDQRIRVSLAHMAEELFGEAYGNPNLEAILNKVDSLKSLEEISAFILDTEASFEGYILIKTLQEFSKGNPFSTTMHSESDASTSGTIISHLVAGLGNAASLEKLNAGGILTTEDKSLKEWKNKTVAGELVNKDNYENFVELWKKEIIKNSASSTHLMNFIMGPLQRKDGKTPVLIYNYGAGRKKIVDTFNGVTFIDALYNKLYALKNSSEKEYNDLLEALQNVARIKDIRNFDIQRETFSPSAIRSLVMFSQNTYGVALGEALAALDSGLKDSTAPLIEASGVAIWMFEWKLSLWETQIKTKYNRNPTVQERADFEKGDEFNSWLPKLKSVDAESANEGLINYKIGRKDSKEKKNKVTVRTQKQSKISNSSAIIYESTYEAPGASIIVRLIQSLEDATIRRVMETNDILSIYDAQLNSLDALEEGTREYNRALLDVLKNYSISGAVADMFLQIHTNFDAEVRNADTPEKLYELAITLDEYIRDKRKHGTFFDKALPLHEAEDKITSQEEASKYIAANQAILTDTLYKLQKNTRTERKNKQELFKKIKVVDHTGLPNTAIKNPDYVTPIKPDLSLDTQHSSASFDIDLFTNKDSSPIDIGSLVDLFNTIGTEQNSSPSNSAYLSKLLHELISPVLNRLSPMALTIIDTAKETAGAIQGSDIFLQIKSTVDSTYTAMSAQEVYVHELIHAITSNALVDPQNNAVFRNVSRLRKEVAEALEKASDKPYEIFLSHDDKGEILYKSNEDTEIQEAKRQYNYIFNNNDVKKVSYKDKLGNTHVIPIAAGLLEFVAFGLTNQNLLQKLSEIEINFKDRSKTFIERLKKLFLQLVDKILHPLTINKVIAGPANDVLANLVKDLKYAHQKRTYSSQKVMEALKRANSIINDKVIDWVMDPLAKLTFFELAVAGKAGNITRKLMSPITIGAFLLNEVNPAAKKDKSVQISVTQEDGSIKYIPWSRYDEYSAGFKKMKARMGILRKGNLSDIWHDLRGNVSALDSAMEDKLLKSKMNIDHMQQRVIATIEKLFPASFSKELSSTEEEALTRVLFKTDITALFDTLDKANAQELVALLKNSNNKRKALIKQYNKELDTFKKEGNYFKSQAKALGRFLVTGTSHVHIGLNAHVIAKGYLTYGLIKLSDEDANRAEFIIDKLATLHALDNTSPDMLRTTAHLIESEFNVSPKENGITFTYNVLKKNKKESLVELFGGNKVQVRKGYIKELVDPKANIIGVPIKDIDTYLFRGYKLLGSLEKHPTDTTLSDTVLLTSNFDGNDTRDRGIISLTSRQKIGFSIKEGSKFAQMDSAAYRKRLVTLRNIAKKAKEEVLQQMKGHDLYSDKKSIPTLLPTLNEQGNIVDFRYVMAHETKEKYLKQNLKAGAVLAGMEGSNKGKAESLKGNEDVFKTLAQEYLVNGIKDAHEFITLSANSPSDTARELYRLIPREARIEAQKIFKGPIRVREQYLTILFGSVRMSLAPTQFTKITESIWKELIGLGKKNVVIKNITTLKKNIVSNTLAGFLWGVPLEYMVSEQVKGVKYIQNFVSDQNTWDQLKLRYKTLNNKATPEAKRIKNEMHRLKNNMDVNPIKPLIDMGAFATIVEDVSLKDDPYAYSSQFAEWSKSLIKINVDSPAKKLPKAVFDLAYMSENTSVFKFLAKTTQFSDLVARYALYTYKTQVEPISKQERNAYRKRKLSSQGIREERARIARQIVLDTFIVYDTPTSKYLNYVNDMGLAPFTKYPMRILRVILAITKGQPANLLLLNAVENLLNTNFSDVTDSNLLQAAHNPLSMLMEATDMQGLSLPSNLLKAAKY